MKGSIERAFLRARKKRRAAFIPYITAGDPTPSLTVPLMRALVAAGADVRELGVPFSDPMADGPGVQSYGVRALADGVDPNKDVGAAVAGGSFRTRGMIVAPCTIKTLPAIANSFTYNLIVRAADVTLKERRTLVLMVRETPLHKGHLELMTRAADCGAVILPPMPSFYHKPATIMDIVHQSIGKALDQVGIEHDLFKRWSGHARNEEPKPALHVAT